MQEKELIQMRNKLNIHSKMIEAIVLQQKTLEQYIGVTMETMKRMDGFTQANLQLQKDLRDSQEESKNSQEKSETKTE
jgi:low affinity Fe/Cu permease